MTTYNPLRTLPTDIQRNWNARLIQTEPTEAGAFRLVAANRTNPAGSQGQRVTVLVLDENGAAVPGIKVAFSYSTADWYEMPQDMKWFPPAPQRAFIVETGGDGEIDQIQGGGVKQGQPGGITVYIFEPEYSSDVVEGAGMLADHTGLHLTYQLRRTGVKSTDERLDNLEDRMEILEGSQED